MTEPEGNVWSCKIGFLRGSLPDGADWPMRRAVEQAFEALLNQWPDFIFSGWGAELTETERAALERTGDDDLPQPWWTIHGEELQRLLRRAAAGEDPDVLYMEAYANSEQPAEEG